jgi:hypothetical protein
VWMHVQRAKRRTDVDESGNKRVFFGSNVWACDARRFAVMRRVLPKREAPLRSDWKTIAENGLVASQNH